MKKGKELLTLFLEFARMGCCTFGGGWSIVAQMQLLYVEKKKTITAEELLDLTSVAKSLPGTMVGNVAMLYGYRMGGYIGGVLTTVGMVLPPLCILAVITMFYKAFRSNYWVNAVMAGMQAAVVPIIASSAIALVKGSVKDVPTLIVLLACFGLYFAGIGTYWLILLGVAAGLAIAEYRERRGRRNGSA